MDIHKRDLIRDVARATGLGQATVERVMDGLTAEIAATLAVGGAVVWTGFGRWELRRRRARAGINPATQAALSIAPSTLPGWQVAEGYKGRVAALVALLRDGALAAD